MKFRIAVAVLMTLGVANQPAGSQVTTIDLIADSIAYSFPAPDSIQVDAVFSIYNSFERDSTLLSDVTLFLDGIAADWSPLDIDASEAVCREDPDCKPEMCDAIVGQGEATVINCKWARPVPMDSIWICVCWGSWHIRFNAEYAGQSHISFLLDSANEVIEANEANNEISVEIEPIPTLGRPALAVLAALLVLVGVVMALRRVRRVAWRPS